MSKITIWWMADPVINEQPLEIWGVVLGRHWRFRAQIYVGLLADVLFLYSFGCILILHTTTLFCIVESATQVESTSKQERGRLGRREKSKEPEGAPLPLPWYASSMFDASSPLLGRDCGRRHGDPRLWRYPFFFALFLSLSPVLAQPEK